MDTDLGLIRFMLNPESYPDFSPGVTHLETHISHVFICNDFVYKIKKPVNLGFLDFTALRKRHFFCRQEVSLNRRLAGETYLGVEALYRKGNDYFFRAVPGGHITEYAVKMKRISFECLLYGLIEEGRPLYNELEPVGQRLAEFHGEAKVYRGLKYGSLETMAKATEENFEQISPFCGNTIDLKLYDQLVEYTTGFLKEKASLFSLRRKAGFVRDGHGDLHTQHICLTRPPIIFDCIEFNESFRIIDVLEDIAFLFMDMEYRARFDLSSRLCKAYFASQPDSPDEELLRFYKIYRAVVRGKVEAIRAQGLNDGVERDEGLRHSGEYFRLAEYYLNHFKQPFNPIVFMGLSGSGKSAISRDFSKDAIILRSDELRKAISGVSKGDHRYVNFGEGIYSDTLTKDLYCALLEETLENVERGRRVVVDATFLKKNQRRDFYERCRQQGLNPFFIHCFAREEVLKERIRKRMEMGTDVSDAHTAILERQMSDMEEPVELPYCRVLRLNTEEKLHNIINALKEFL